MSERNWGYVGHGTKVSENSSWPCCASVLWLRLGPKRVDLDDLRKMLRRRGVPMVARRYQCDRKTFIALDKALPKRRQRAQ